MHFLGLYTNEPGNPDAIQPDDQGYLVLKNNKLRLKFKKVHDLIGMDTLATLIDKCKLIFNATYKINSCLNRRPCDFNVMGSKLIELDGCLIGLDQAFELMIAQYRLRKSTIHTSPDIEELWAEFAFLLDPNENNGHYSFKRVVLANRGMQLKN